MFFAYGMFLGTSFAATIGSKGFALLSSFISVSTTAFKETSFTGSGADALTS
jgi:hypothetical protein